MSTYLYSFYLLGPLFLPLTDRGYIIATKLVP
jgi:hypothetical protein